MSGGQRRDQIVRRVLDTDGARLFGRHLFAWMREKLELALSTGQRDLRILVRQQRLERSHDHNGESWYSPGPNWWKWEEVP